jgi:hypothetical protein
MDRNNRRLPLDERLTTRRAVETGIPAAEVASLATGDAIGWAEAITDHERRQVRLEECEHQLRALTAWARYLEVRVDHLSQGAEP